MVCSVIDECRCFAYSDVSDPRKEQFCGARKGPHIAPCPADCCAGGCPGQTPKIEPREPFRVVERPSVEDSYFKREPVDMTFLMFVTVAFLLLYLS